MEAEEITIIKKLQKKILKAPKMQPEIKNQDLYQRINTFITVKNQNLYMDYYTPVASLLTAD